ncbi:MAG: hypothetical protein IPM66_03345 [Acidobacteriota bacterium]|nr:MAG: hypothetical protein IPM66_03345 [Acidobacteriota bacterium]
MSDNHITDRLIERPFASLTGQEIESMERHAAECDACRGSFDAARIASDALAARRRIEVSPTPFFGARVMARRQPAGRFERLRRLVSRGHFGWRYATLVVSLAVAALTSSIWLGNSTAPKEAVIPVETPVIEDAGLIVEYDDIPAEIEDGESVTEFYPLTWQDDPLEGGQMIRVQVSRSALMVYGIPFNPEREEEQIMADVIIGDDGLARAIRFIH